jgi:hypothetical protein
MNQAEKDLEIFLLENPELVPLQRKIEKYLNEQHSPQERMNFLLKHISDNLYQLSIELKLIENILEKKE